jgi:PEP-CTERM motif-containing protein
MRSGSLLCLALASLFSTPIFANTTPFSYSVDSFLSPERGFSDTFGDGVIGPQWLAFGTVNESSGVATFSNPGVPGFLLPFPLDSDTSGINGFGSVLNGGGSFETISIWLPEVPDPGTSFSMALGSMDGLGNTHQIALSVTNTNSDVARVLSTAPGLNVDLILQVRNASFVITSWDTTSQAFTASDVIGSVILSLQFDDLLNEVRGVYSLDSGVTLRLFDPVAWNFGNGQFALVSSATAAIPEPGTAALLGLGLAAFGASRHSMRWKQLMERGGRRCTVPGCTS